MSPGGFVNGVSKRPTDTPKHDLGLQYGNNDRKQLFGDFSGPLGDSKTLSYRLALLTRDSDTQQDHINEDKTYIAPALTWRPNDDTSLTLLSFHQKSDTRFSAPLPYQLVKGVGNGPNRHGMGGQPYQAVLLRSALGGQYKGRRLRGLLFTGIETPVRSK